VKYKKNRISEPEHTYGEEYLNWKTWEGDQFGKLKKTKFTYFSAEIKRTTKVFSKESKVLEIGFGNGEFLKYARDNDWEIFGTEANKALVDIANKNGFKAIHTEDLSSFEDNTFDLIVAFDVLEHIPQEILPKMLLQVRRILKNDGVFLARFPNGDSPFGLINQNGDATHVNFIGSNMIKYFASKTNMLVFFVGSEAQPIIGTSPKTFIHTVTTLPIKKLINFFINLIFFPHGHVEFCSSNLTIILKVKNY
jgi:SAM-dependent methyltransferase